MTGLIRRAQFLASGETLQRRTLRVLTGETVIVVRVPTHPNPLEAAIEVARLALANLAP